VKEVKRKIKPDEGFSRRTSKRIDDIVGIFSPRTAYRRKAYRFGYEILDRHRTRKKRSYAGGTGDTHLDEVSLDKLREISRELSRNNALANGLLKIERNGIIGSGVKIQARTDDDKLNEDIEAAWKETMLDSPCDRTGRFNFNQYLRKYFLSYRRDGDILTIFLDDALQAVEGEGMGTPYGRAKPESFEIINGVAFSKKSGKVIGYYIGKPDKWGYIKRDSWKNYRADRVHHCFDPERFSQSRGEPVLTPSVKYIDHLSGYIEAELVAAKVNACFSMFISRKDVEPPNPYTGGISPSGRDEDDNRLEKMEPGSVLYGEDGESAVGIGQTRPGSLFDPFVLRMLTFIGRPLCMPLMLITMDFSGATFMNARLAYQKVQEAWQAQQDNVVKPFVSRVWRWKLARLLETKQIKTKKLAGQVFRHVVFCRRWPYVDPSKESKADEQQLRNGTTHRTIICARQGDDFIEVNKQLGAEEVLRKEQGLAGKDDKKAKMMEDLARGVRAGVPIAVAEARTALGLTEKPPAGELLRFNDQDVLQYHIESGILTINEIRAVLGLEEVDWGNVPVRKTGVSPVSTSPEEKQESESEEENGDESESEIEDE